jgi:hypothetical protein
MLAIVNTPCEQGTVPPKRPVAPEKGSEEPQHTRQRTPLVALSNVPRAWGFEDLRCPFAPMPQPHPFFCTTAHCPLDMATGLLRAHLSHIWSCLPPTSGYKGDERVALASRPNFEDRRTPRPACVLPKAGKESTLLRTPLPRCA